MKKLFVVAMAVAFFTPAQAADMPVKAPPGPMVAVYNWTGFYIGGNVGAAWLKKSVTEVGADILDNPVGSTFSLRDSSITGGAQAGYNWHSNNLLIGIEADINWTRIDKTIFATVSGSTDGILHGKVDWFATFRGRLGYAPGPWLIYVTGGGALAKLVNEYGDVDSGVLDPTAAASVNETRWGWTVGGGAEVAFGGNWSAKAEYLYIDFRKFDEGPVVGGSAGVARFHDRIHVARVGLNYRFGGPVVARY
jgi:outer membrane immunogenic protein